MQAWEGKGQAAHGRLGRASASSRSSRALKHRQELEKESKVSWAKKVHA